MAGLAGLLAAPGLHGCRPPGWTEPAPEERTRVHEARAPSERERYCAWFGDAREGVLYFGASPFWSAWREAGGDPTAELRLPGPLLVGRFDLERRTFLPPLSVAEEAPGSVWDVLAHPNGRIYFTTYFGSAGWVEPESGRVERLEAAGTGLAELALGPGGDLLASRYGGAGGGAVLRITPDGRVRAEHGLAPPEGRRVAAKSVAWDPVRREIWVTTDLLPAGAASAGAAAGAAAAHDARVLAEDGGLLRRFARPELQFVTFGPEGTGYFAERHGALLTLRVRPPERAGRALLTGRRVPLDDAFPSGRDFVQEIRAGPGGGAVVTRWSGRVHLVGPEGRVRSVTLPRPEPGGLYYTGVLAEDALCATFCGGLRVVCRELAP